MILSDDQIKHFRRHGYLKASGLIDSATVERLPEWVDEVAAAPLLAGRQMVYLEDAAAGGNQKAVSRIEKFLEIHSGLRALALSSNLYKAASQLFGEPAVLFKDKINFQPPGGGGILPHQDIQAGWLDYAETFISIAVTVDESTVDNGCTEIDVSWQSSGLIGTLWEPLGEQAMESIQFTKFPTQPGDVIFFDGFVPHRALPNQTGQQRRIIFLTYNPASEGDHSQRYYADKRKNYPPDNERDPAKSYVFRV